MIVHFHWEEIIEKEGDEFDHRILRNPHEFFVNAKLERDQQRLAMIKGFEKSNELNIQAVENNNQQVKRLQEFLSKYANTTVRVDKNAITTISPEVIKQLGLGENRGEGGAAVHLTNVPPEIQKKIDAGWEAHQFNEFVSDLISV